MDAQCFFTWLASMSCLVSDTLVTSSGSCCWRYAVIHPSFDFDVSSCIQLSPTKFRTEYFEELSTSRCRVSSCSFPENEGVVSRHVDHVLKLTLWPTICALACSVSSTQSDQDDRRLLFLNCRSWWCLCDGLVFLGANDTRDASSLNPKIEVPASLRFSVNFLGSSRRFLARRC